MYCTVQLRGQAASHGTHTCWLGPPFCSAPSPEHEDSSLLDRQPAQLSSILASLLIGAQENCNYTGFYLGEIMAMSLLCK